jgi:hypothetical protein
MFSPKSMTKLEALTVSYKNINCMRNRCTVHVVLQIIYMIQQKNKNNHMRSNMLTLLAGL